MPRTRPVLLAVDSYEDRLVPAVVVYPRFLEDAAGVVRAVRPESPTHAARPERSETSERADRPESDDRGDRVDVRFSTVRTEFFARLTQSDADDRRTTGRFRLDATDARPDRVIGLALPQVVYWLTKAGAAAALPKPPAEASPERFAADVASRVAAVLRTVPPPGVATDLNATPTPTLVSADTRSPEVNARTVPPAGTTDQRSAPAAVPVTTVGMATSVGEVAPESAADVPPPPAEVPPVEFPLAPPLALPTAEDLGTFGLFLGVPLAGAVGIDLDAAKAGADELLIQLADLAEELPAADVHDPSLWLAGAAVLAAAAGYAVANAPRRRAVRPGPLPDSVLARWEAAHAG